MLAMMTKMMFTIKIGILDADDRDDVHLMRVIIIIKLEILADHDADVHRLTNGAVLMLF